MQKFWWLFLFFITFSVFEKSYSQAILANSQKYSNFDDSSDDRLKFILSENRRVNQRLANSSNRKNIESYLKKNLDGESIIDYAQLKNGVLELVDHGLGKAQELILTVGDKKEVIFSNFQFKRNNSLRAIVLKVNPEQSKVALIFQKDGSNDDSFLTVIDLNSKKIIVENNILYFHGTANEIYWASNEDLLFKDTDNSNINVIKKIHLSGDRQNITTLYENYEIYFVDEHGIAIKNKNNHYIYIPDMNTKYEIDGLDGYEYLGMTEQSNYFLKTEFQEQSGDQTGLYLLNQSKKKLELVKSFNGNVTRTFLLSDAFVFVEQQGFKKTINYYNFSTRMKTSSSLPDYIRLSYAMETSNSKEILLGVGSDLISRKKIIWDIESNLINFGENFQKEMLESPELSIDVVFRLVRSFDGTLIPIRIVSKKGTELRNVPVYMEAYGGFDVLAYLLPKKDQAILEFIKHGGVYVGTGLRGGSEFGESWHKSAMFENKFKTFEDLAAIAKSLIDTGVSSKEKIAVKGRSNGGLTVAATGLLYPQYFGLIISENGVLDLLSKEKLDARFNEGWIDEYGDSRTPDGFKYLINISPLENINKAVGGPNFLIINGRDDTRVNPAHSIKFAKAASDLKLLGLDINIEMLSVNNSGHHVSDPENDYIGLRTQLIMWSRIYDQFGMQF